MKIALEERSFELFPDEIFRKDFQQELQGVYNSLAYAIAQIKNPTHRFNKIWYFIYHISFFSDDNFEMAFVEPTDFLNGIIHVAPLREPSLNHEDLLVRNENIFVPAGIQPMSLKYFERKIKFIDINRRDLILKYFECNPVVLDEAIKRFPQSGLMVVERNKILRTPYLLTPSSSQFPKLLNFSKKIRKILREAERYEKY